MAEKRLIKNTKRQLVTIIIPAFNHEQFVEQALLSAIHQDYGNLEIIVIDDGSTDGTAAVIEDVLARSSNHRDVKFIRQTNQGLSRTLNKGLEMSGGEFVHMLASDDAYLPAKTSVCVDRLSALPESVGAIYCDGYVVDQDNNKLMKFSELFPRPLSSNTYKELLVGNWIPAMGLFYRKKALLAAGGFDESIQVEDWELLLRLTRTFRVSSIPDLLFLYRSHASNFSNDRPRMLSQQDAIAEKHGELRRRVDGTGNSPPPAKTLLETQGEPACGRRECADIAQRVIHTAVVKISRRIRGRQRGYRESIN
jgi:glycosyltransferase involved in cell wall biosynthesis